MGLLLQNIPGAPDLDTAIRFAEEAVAVEFPNAAKVLNALLKLRPERKSTGAGQDARYAIVL